MGQARPGGGIGLLISPTGSSLPDPLQAATKQFTAKTPEPLAFAPQLFSFFKGGQRLEPSLTQEAKAGAFAYTGKAKAGAFDYTSTAAEALEASALSNLPLANS